jgi:histone-lysine N-methyltransferase SETD3
MITLEMAKTLPEVTKLAEEVAQLKSPKHCMLSVFLLVHMQKGQNSPYFNYIQCFPKKLSNFPIYYSDELLDELEATYFLSVLKRKKAEIEEDFKGILSLSPELKPLLSYEKFVWARMIVSSRIFGMVINGRKTDALVPIADMLNHKMPKLTSWYFSDERRGFIVQNADQEILKGQ